MLLTLSAHGADGDTRQMLLNMGAIVVMCVLIYVFFFNARLIDRFLGSQGERIFNRIMAIFIFCVGPEIAATWTKSLF